MLTAWQFVYIVAGSVTVIIAGNAIYNIWFQWPNE